MMTDEGSANPYDGIKLVTSEDVPETLWHYTDADGLFGILTKGRLWATDVSHLNDPSEVRHGEAVALRVAQTLLEVTDDPHARLAVQGFIDEWPIESAAASQDVFVASFCDDEGDRLSQWRGYGAGGAGYSIGLRNLGKLTSKFSAMVFKVRYDSTINADSLSRDFLAIAEVLKQYTDDPQSLPEAIATATATMRLHALLFALKTKHAGFSEENEWRIVAFPSGSGKKSKVSSVLFRPSRRGIIPYVTMPCTGEDGRVPLAKIYVGPSHNSEASVQAVRGLLDKLKYPNPELLVDKSAIPYRP